MYYVKLLKDDESEAIFIQGTYLGFHDKATDVGGCRLYFNDKKTLRLYMKKNHPNLQYEIEEEEEPV
jgi:hypothetical protein